MNTSFHPATTGRAIRLLVLSGVFVAMQVGAQPAQKPLLAASSGAKPNLMIALDNSGSMAYPHHESYGVILNTNAATALLRCAPPLYANSAAAYVLGGTVDPSKPAGNRCLTATAFDAFGNPTSYNWSASNGTAYAPAVTATYSLLAKRSADLNPVYYNPRTTYSPRIGPDYLPLTRPATPTFISNQVDSVPANAFYQVYRDPGSVALYTVNAQKPAPVPRPAWATPIDTASTATGNRVYALRTYSFPVHAEISNAGNNLTPDFRYTYCRSTAGASTVQTTPDGMDVGCSSVRRTPFATSADGTFVSVYAPGHPSAAGNIIALPADHQRTDCLAGGSCTNGEELINILNWYHWYSTRQLATSTAIGQSLAATAFQGELRIGYMPINDFELAGTGNMTITATPGTVNRPTLLRGVRMLAASDPTNTALPNTQLFNWLNRMVSRGGTPLHNAITKVADYYNPANAGVTESPWSTDPSQPTTYTLPGGAPNVEMSCRRSFNLLFSDGGWSNVAGYVPATAGPDDDNTNGPNSPPFSRVNASGATETFRYLSTGVNTVAGRKLYTPYPSAGRGGLADLTAGYFWHTDLRTSLANNIQTRSGQPTFWQNMTTYTVGYMIQPTADATGGAGLSFARIDQYQSQYATSGYAAATKPVWPLGDLRTSATQARVDDFIQAGYTGGGRSFSATTSDDVRRIFDTIVSEILSASGKDAGVSVSSGGSDTATLVDRLKYGVTYRTLDNSGEITAQELDAEGNVTGTRWTASNLIPAHNLRRVFSISGTDQPVDFSGNFSALASDIRTAIRQGPDAARVATDASFINYLRGLDPVADPAGKLFRQRSSTLGAMVNPPSSYMGGKGDFAYDLQGTVEGSTSYRGFTDRKRGYPASLFVATNAGMMHALDAENGNELAAVMPRRSLSRMLNYADEAYNFEYVLDGPLSAHDIYDNRAPAPTSDWMRWKHMSVGTGGRGEPLIYAVKSPIKPGNGVTPANRIPDRPDFLWETGPDLVSDTSLRMGYITNPARSGQTMDGAGGAGTGTWVVAINNGHYNGEADGSKAGLIVLNPLTGAVLRRIPLPAGYSAGRGLSGVTLLRDNDGTKRVIGAYAGDAYGNLWRFDLRGSPSEWRVSYGRPIFTTPNHRPIYGAPAWQMHPEKGTIVIVATGMMLEEGDLGDTANNESIYGIWDPTVIGADDESPFTTVEAASLVTQSVTAVGATTAGGRTYYRSSTNRVDWETNRGWTMPLGYSEEGERSIAEVQNLKTSVVITTTVLRSPADPDAEICSVSDLPANFIYVLNARDGQHRRSFDIDNDNRLDDFSVAYVPGGGFARGVSIVQRVPAATEAIPTDPSEPTSGLTGNVNDPKEPLADSVRENLSNDEAAGESSTLKCKKVLATALGTESNPIELGVDCPVTGWSRSQYQLSAPPSN